jgi:RHS repeat-associated protein
MAADAPASPFAATAISLPKGGGAIKGIGEKFAANPVTGTGAMIVPIATSPGRSDFGPQLALSYDSGAGNGPFGFGWSLSAPSITRKTDKGLPQYRDAEESDVFILSGAEDLVPLLNPDGSRFADTTAAAGYTIHRYRPRIEGLFARIERWTRQSDGDVHWRSMSKDNILTLYGKDSHSRIFDPDDPRRIFSWLICEKRDDKGNAVLYHYMDEDGTGVDLSQAHERNRGGRDDPRRKVNRYLKRITYGNRVSLLDGAGARPRFLTPEQIDAAGWMFEVVLDYGEHDATAPTPGDAGPWTYRADPFSSYRSGFEMRTGRLCQRVLMFHHFASEPGVGDDCLVRSTDITYTYEQDPTNARNPVYTFLCAVTRSGYQRHNGGYLKRSLPPVEFEYSQPVVQDAVQEVDAESLENLPIGLDGSTYQWIDLDGEGVSGILTAQAGAWFYKRNLSPISDRPVEFGPSERVATKPSIALAGGQAQFMDLAGDGQLDLVVLDGPMPGFYEHDGQDGWQSFRTFSERLNRDTRDPNLKFVDLDGDGHADVLISEDDAFVWHASLGEEGFGPACRVAQALDEEHGPRLVFSDGEQSIFLADMCGDGLTDLVRIRNGEVCYWPNLGYGRFGAKVSMDNAPRFDHPDAFDPRRIRVADIDGTGTNDIIYLHRDGVRLYFNQSGNSWGAPQPLLAFVGADDIASITPTDLQGNGTACLVWSSPLPGDAQKPMRYVDLMGGRKPHLLIKTVNNLGAETGVQYAPSTTFYLQDKRDGKPWITRLPFPVHVVERVETNDHISRNRFVTRYAYHHGYFDGEEREFRGFGMVEQFDTEEFAALAADGALPAASNLDAASHVPPVHTKTWFHTGAYLGREHVSDFFAGLIDAQDAGEYYREPGLDDVQAEALLLADTVLPPGLSVEEEREACRALKGSMLRQEVYALDGTDKEQHPYIVTEQNFTISVLQRHGDNRHAVFFTHAREAISYHYERNPADPRISHALTLETDEFGDVLKSLAIGYGRRAGRSPLQGADKERQEQQLITYTESDYTKNDMTDPVAWVDAHRTPLPSEVRTYELTGLALANGAVRFAFDDFANDDFAALTSLDTIPYEAPVPATVNGKRLIECIRTLYRSDDLTALLPTSTVQSRALPGESYKLAFTPGLLNVYAAKIASANLIPILQDEGKYVDLDGDGRWWIPSGRAFYSTNAADDPQTEAAEATQHFFLPRRYRDPFGHDTTVDYDGPPDPALPRYDVLMTRTQDPVQNVVRAENDYRVLQPWRMTDPNGNRSEVAIDTLGMVAGTAVKGKDDTVGDTLDGFEPDLTQAQINGFSAAADPHVPAPGLLRGATTRIVYDLDRFRGTRQAHPADPTQWLPASAATLARETHVSDPLPPQGLRIQIGFSYTDGFGREIQKKIQAEPGPLVADGPVVNPRWVGSGWTIFNNKGKPVRQYEPFFGPAHHFEFANQVGVSPILFYDPAGRVVATLHPNHTWEKVVFDPWQQTTYDVNDTVLNADDSTDPKADQDVQGFFVRLPDEDYLPTWYEQRITLAASDPERVAADKAAVHRQTPTVAHFDTLGRAFLTLAHNRFVRDSGTVEEKYPTRVELDIEGNQRAVIDTKDRIVMRYDFDLLGSPIHSASMEAGERWMLNDVTGKPIRTWDTRGFMRRLSYDALRRPVGLYVSGNGLKDALAEQMVYGDDARAGPPNPERTNHRGRVYQVRDGAGLVTSVAYDFKGNPLVSTRQLADDFKTTPDWANHPALESEIFTGSMRFDALNRPVQLIAPRSDQPGAKRHVIQPAYNEANMLERVDVWLDHSVEPVAWLDVATAPPSDVGVSNIDYDAKGQRLRIAYKNGTTTHYTYDPQTFRLVQLLTQRDAAAFPDDCLQPPPTNWPGCQVQNLHYTYDPAGNITHIRDESQQTIFFRNKRVEPSAGYTYDALYRLISATGREHIGQTNQPETTWGDEFRIDLSHPGDGRAMRPYAEQYEYDSAGNILRMIHQASNGNWTRGYAYGEDSLIEPNLGKVSNRLSSTQVGSGLLEPFTYDAHGSMITMPHLPLMQWDFKDQLSATSRQVVNEASPPDTVPETTFYAYDAGGQRVRKVTERQNGSRKQERIYLGGFELYREFDGNGETVTLERETLHIMDDRQRIALVETRTQGDDGSPAQLIRYQLGNHLGSASLELDAAGDIISYEEYYPYGSTSYQAVDKSIKAAAKRYRFTGKERDEETGLCYHGARYFSPTITRWISADPTGLADGLNVYIYARNDPVNNVDDNGRETFNAGEQVQTFRDDAGNAFVEFRAKENTWISASAKSLGLNAVYTKEQGYGAYVEGVVLNSKGQAFADTDKLEVGEVYYIRIGEGTHPSQPSEPQPSEPQPPPDQPESTKEPATEPEGWAKYIIRNFVDLVIVDKVSVEGHGEGGYSGVIGVGGEVLGGGGFALGVITNPNSPDFMKWSVNPFLSGQIGVSGGVGATGPAIVLPPSPAPNKGGVGLSLSISEHFGDARKATLGTAPGLNLSNFALGGSLGAEAKAIAGVSGDVVASVSGSKMDDFWVEGGFDFQPVAATGEGLTGEGGVSLKYTFPEWWSGDLLPEGIRAYHQKYLDWVHRGRVAH